MYLSVSLNPCVNDTTMITAIYLNPCTTNLTLTLNSRNH